MDKETLDAVNKAVADALAPVVATVKTLGDNQKVIADTMAADAAAKAQAAKDTEAAKAEAAKKPADAKPGEARPLSQEDVDKLVSQKLDAFTSRQTSSAQREAFIGEKLKGVPKAYHAQLGSDPAKWAAEEQAIRDQVKADDAARGIVIKDVSGGNPGGASASGASPAEVSARFKAAGLSDGEAAFASSLKMPV